MNMAITLGTIMPYCRPIERAQYPESSGIINPPVLCEVFQKPHQVPRSECEYYVARGFAHGETLSA